jgi:hypothetical protein
MNKKTFMDRLRALGVNASSMCLDLGIHTTTASRWRDAPAYAIAYLLALEMMDARQRIVYRHNLAMSKLVKENIA